jgi:DNA-binding CsgD family transcriptional regulator
LDHRHVAGGSVRITKRQREIIALVLRGVSNKEIARTLGIGEQAVKDHVSRLLAKFAVPSRTALAAALAPQLEVLGDINLDRGWMRQLFIDAEVQIAILSGPDLRYEAANKAFIRAVQRPVLGRTMRDAFPELEGQGIYEKVDRVYSEGEALVDHERISTWNTGAGLESRYIDLVLQPLRDEDGAVNGVLSLAVDVTEQIRKRERANPKIGPARYLSQTRSPKKKS